MKYARETRIYTTNGEKAHWRTYDPTQQTTYALAWALLRNEFRGNKDKDNVRTVFLQRLQGLIERTAAHHRNEGRTIPNLDTFCTVLGNNLYDFLEDILKDGPITYKNHEHKKVILTPEPRSTTPTLLHILPKEKELPNKRVTPKRRKTLPEERNYAYIPAPSNEEDYTHTFRELPRTQPEPRPQDFATIDDYTDAWERWQEPTHERVRNSNPNKQERSATNRLIFGLRLQSRISHLLTAPYVYHACSDYETVQAVQHDPEQFSALEALCQQALDQFVYRKRVRSIDEEAQRQEGRIAIWKAAKNYRAENFARVNTMMKTVLHYLYCNLLQFSQADCRRINSSTYAMGTSQEDSPLAQKVADLSHELWQETQLQPLDFDAPEPDSYNPFATTTLLDHRLPKRNKTEQRLKARKHTITNGKAPQGKKELTILTSYETPPLQEEKVVTHTTRTRIDLPELPYPLWTRAGEEATEENFPYGHRTLTITPGWIVEQENKQRTAARIREQGTFDPEALEHLTLVDIIKLLNSTTPRKNVQQNGTTII